MTATAADAALRRAEPWGRAASTERAGRRLAWRDSATGGPALLLVMGLGADSTSWAAHAGPWSGRFRCVAVDNAGAGGTDPLDPLRTADMAEDCLAVLDALDLEQAAAVGVSMGGAVVQELSLRHPGRLRGQVLVGTWAAATPYMRAAFSHLAALQGGGSPDVFARALQLFIWGSGWVDGHLGELDAELGEPGAPMPPAHFRAQVAACLAHDTGDALAALRVPTLVTHGTEDRLVPVAVGRAMAAAVPGARLIELVGRGHAHHWEALEEFNTLVADWIGDLR